MVLGGLMLADMVGKSGLLKRIAFKCIIVTGATYSGIIWGLGLAGLLLWFIIPGQAFIPMCAVAFGIINVLNLGKSKASAGIMMGAAFSCMLPGWFLFTPIFYLYGSFASAAIGTPHFAWLDFFTKQWPCFFAFVLVLFLRTKLCRPKEAISGKAYFKQEYQSLGKLSVAEIKAIIVCLLLLGFIMTTDIHGISAMWGFAVIPLLLYLPGIGIAEEHDLEKTNFSMPIFVVACMSIGTVGASLGLGKIFSDLALPLLTGKSVTFVFFFIYILCVLLNFLMTPIAIAAAFTLPLCEICMQLGINTNALLLFLLQALDQVFLPYEYVMYLVAFSFGVMELKHFVQLMSMKFLVNIIFMFAILLPYWHLIGFIAV